MVIKDIQEIEVGEEIKLEGLVKKIETRQKNNGDDYLFITIVDSTGEVSFPVWDRINDRLKVLKELEPICVVAKIGMYNKVKQLNLVGFKASTVTDKTKFIASYDRESKQFAKLIDLIMQTLFKVKEDGLRNFLGHYLFSDNFDKDDFFKPDKYSLLTDDEKIKGISKFDTSRKFITAPAAVHHHQNRIGGLLVHTAGVVKNIVDILDTYCESFNSNDDVLFINADNVVDVDLLLVGGTLHDIEKIEEYDYQVTIARNTESLGHRLMFLKRSQTINDKYEDLTEERLCQLQQLILTHHGPWGGNKPKDINGIILFCADFVDSRIAGCSEEGNPISKIDIKSMIDAE